MVGLFAYNSPACIDAIKEADKLGQIKICGFDEQDALLQAITDGHAYVYHQSTPMGVWLRIH